MYWYIKTILGVFFVPDSEQLLFEKSGLQQNWQDLKKKKERQLKRFMMLKPSKFDSIVISKRCLSEQ